MSDREEAGLRGPIKTCIDESTDHSIWVATTEYSVDGKLLATRFTHPDGSGWVTTREYNPDGRLARVTSPNSSEPGADAVYAYDDVGRTLSITNTKNSDRTDFHYDELGRKMGIQRFDPNTLQRARNCAFAISAWEAAAVGAGVPAGGSIATIYDENDRPVEARLHDAEDHIVSRIVRTYNAAGLVTEERPILENPGLMFLNSLPAGEDQPTPAQILAMNKGMSTLMSGRAQTGTFNAYDAHNRITTVRECNFVFEKTTEVIYNDQGDRVEEHITIAGNSVVPVGISISIEEDGTLTPVKGDVPQPTPFDPPQRSEVRYAYEYDDHGNWTQQMTSHGQHSDGLSSVRNRRLTYY
jgi:YD repeat-containing protein